MSTRVPALTREDGTSTRAPAQKLNTMRSLRIRLILSHVGLILLVISLLGIALIYFLETRVVLANLSIHLRRQAGLLAEFSADYPSTWAEQNLQAEVADVWAPVFAADGELLGAVRLTHQLGNVRERFQVLRTLIGAVLALGMGLGGLTALLLAVTLERPIRQFGDAVYRMASGDALRPVPEQGPAELRALAFAAVGDSGLRLESFGIDSARSGSSSYGSLR